MRRARPGGALYPVLVIAVVLFGMAMALPQVLIGASGSMQLDTGRDRKREALESAVAFAEARLKRELGQMCLGGPAELGVVMPTGGADFPLNGMTVSRLPPFSVRPSFANPDYGARKVLDWELRCLRVALWDFERTEATRGPAPPPGASAPAAPANAGYQETYRFNYLLDGAAWAASPAPGKPLPFGVGGGQLHEEIAGTVEVKVQVDLGQTGLPLRRLSGEPRIAAMAQPRFDAFRASPRPGASP